MAKIQIFQKTALWWKKLTRVTRAFLFIALAFLVVGMGTLGGTQSVGASYELPAKQASDAKTPCIVFALSAPEDYQRENITLTDIYLNIGTVYAAPGTKASLRFSRANTATSTFTSNNTDVIFANVYETVAEGQTATGSSGALYNWISVAQSSTGWNKAGYKLSSYSYYRLTATTCNLSINEVVFAGTATDGETVLIPATVASSSVIYDSEGNLSSERAFDEANALLDSQALPTLAQSSFYRFGEEEVYSLMSLNEMGKATTYKYNAFNGDTVYNALGTSLLKLSTLIFGVSPFGLRFFSMLSAFGILLVGFSLVKKLFQSEKAGLVFALLYTLSGIPFAIGHLGTPLAMGLFFFISSLSACYSFFANGLKKATLWGAKSLVASGLCGAVAICINGAYVLPMLGVVALFVFGVIKQKRLNEGALQEAIEAAEAAEGENQAGAKKEAVKLYNEGAHKQRLSIALFASFLVLGTILISMLSLLPVYHLYTRIYGEGNVLTLVMKGFVGGFIGGNAVGEASSAYSLWYVLFQGAGDSAYAITATGILPAIGGILAGVIGIALAISYLVKAKKGDENFAPVVMLLAGMVLSLIVAFLAKGGLAFTLLAYLFSFAIAAFSYVQNTQGRDEEGNVVAKNKWITVVGLVALCVCFALFACFTFSIPLPVSLVSKF